MRITATTRFLATSIVTLLLLRAGAHAQFLTPNIVTNTGDASTTLGGTLFINHGLQGVGRISATLPDSFGETFGSVSSLQITNWSGSGNYTGTFNILPDRGYNNNNAGGFFSDYAARIQTVNFSFTPYTGSANIGGTTIASQVAAQNQISFTSAINGVRLTYLDPNSNTIKYTTGLDPGSSGQTTLFGKTVPYVIDYFGSKTPGATQQNIPGINKLAIDSEGLVLKPDGSGYVSDEYGANVYYFDANKQIIGVITPTAAVQPKVGSNVDFNSIGTPLQTNGRRNNQGLEGLALSPDGKKLFTLLQSATIQDSNNSQQNRLYTRLAVYDVGTNPTPNAPVHEYVLRLPTYASTGTGTSVTATAAQSEIVAIDDHRILVLSRDAQGGGSSTLNPTMYKSILLVDLSVGTPTDIAGTARDDAGGKVTTSAGVLDPAITQLSWTEAINILNSAQLGKFNFTIDAGGSSQVSKLTLGEKWEGMSLVSVNDPNAPNDYFLFVANDNDFLTSDGNMYGPDGTLVNYNAFANHPANRVPAAVGTSTANESDTVFLAYRVTIVPEPSVAITLLGGLGMLALRRRRSR